MTQQELNQLTYEEKVSFCVNVCKEKIPYLVNSDPQLYFALQIVVKELTPKINK